MKYASIIAINNSISVTNLMAFHILINAGHYTGIRWLCLIVEFWSLQCSWFPFPCFGLVYRCLSILRFCLYFLFESKRRKNGIHKQILHVTCIMIQSNWKYLFTTVVKCSDYTNSLLSHKMAKTYPFCGCCFHTLVEWKIRCKVINKQLIIQILMVNIAFYMHDNITD